MGDGEEGGSTATVRSFEVSISFGRFETDLLSWEKWSSFSQNKYLEEVEKCATPGSVAAKKVFFEARNKLIGVRKADALNKQMEVCQELEESEVQNTCVSEVDQYDEEVIDENFFGSQLSSPSLNVHPELQTSVFISQDPDEQDVIEAISTDDIPNSEASCPLVDDYEKKDSLLFKSEPEMLNKDNTDETHMKAISSLISMMVKKQLEESKRNICQRLNLMDVKLINLSTCNALSWGPRRLME